MTPALENELIHRLKNQIGVALGFVGLMLEESSPAVSRRYELLQVQQAMQRAMELVPEIARQLK